MKLLRTYLLLICLSGIHQVSAQKVELISFADLNKIMQKDDAVYVFNFWATWCGPCVAELPHFITLSDTLQSQVKVVLVSLDFVKELSSVEKFISSKNIHLPVYLLTDADYDSWINRVNPDWSGAIPATLISKGKNKVFYEQPFDFETLLAKVKPFL